LVRKLVAFVSAAAAGFGLVRVLTRRRARAEARLETPADPRAEELRRKLEESRGLADEREQFESGETTVDAADSAPIDPDDRRRAVHEQGRDTVERMRGSDDPDVRH
jgi:hypothetical protein